MNKITKTTIETHSALAGAAGDILMAAICRRALGEGYADYALTDGERRRVDAMTQDEAMAEVCEALASAEAMVD